MPPRSLLALAAGLLLAAGCSQSEAGGGIRNVLLLTLDTTRADRIGAYGYPDAETPNLDRLAAEGVLFEDCVSVAPITLPSHASLLTGLYPIRHGARENGTHSLPGGVDTLAEILAREGFRTGAVVSALVLDSRYGLDQGFQSYDDDLSAGSAPQAYLFRETDAADTTRRAWNFLKTQGEKPWFLWVHYFDPHTGYAPPAPFAERFAGRLYDGEIAYMDQQIGELLRRLEQSGRLDDTLVVVTADHGESLGEHGESTHGIFLYDATTHVPLIFRHSSVAAGRRVAELASGVDLVPTLLDLLGISAPAELDGLSLAPALRPGSIPQPRPPVYQESMSPYFQHGWSDLRAVRSHELRFVRAPAEELYDLDTDPGETRNLLPAAQDRAAPLRSLLEEWLAAGEQAALRATPEEWEDGERAALAELGYVWTADDPQEGEEEHRSSLPDPKDRVADFSAVNAAGELIQQGRYAQAEASLRAVLARNPASTQAMNALADVLVMQQQLPEALKWLHKAVALPGRTARLLSRVATLERRLGRPGWQKWQEAAKRMRPTDPWVWVTEGEWLLNQGELARARAAFERVVEVDANCPEGWLGLAILAEKSARFDEAERHYRQALEASPGLVAAQFGLAKLLLRAGRLPEAEQSYQAILARQPDSLDGLLGAAAACQMGGRESEAASYLRRARRVDAAAVEKRRQVDPVIGAIPGQ